MVVVVQFKVISHVVQPVRQKKLIRGARLRPFNRGCDTAVQLQLAYTPIHTHLVLVSSSVHHMLARQPTSIYGESVAVD